MLKGKAKKDYQRRYMKEYMRERRSRDRLLRPYWMQTGIEYMNSLPLPSQINVQILIVVRAGNDNTYGP